MDKFIMLNGYRYNYNESFENFEEAIKTAKWYKKKGHNYYIMKAEDGFWFPQLKFRLYLTKVWRIGFFGWNTLQYLE